MTLCSLDREGTPHIILHPRFLEKVKTEDKKEIYQILILKIKINFKSILICQGIGIAQSV
jgi:hypothetical protein